MLPTVSRAIIAQGGVAAFRQAKKNHPGNGEIQMINDVMLCNGVDEDVLCIWAESYYAYGRIRIMHMGFNYIMILEPSFDLWPMFLLPRHQAAFGTYYVCVLSCCLFSYLK